MSSCMSCAISAPRHVRQGSKMAPITPKVAEAPPAPVRPTWSTTCPTLGEPCSAKDAAGVPEPSILSTAISVAPSRPASAARSEEHTSELQSPCNLVCRLLLEKKKQAKKQILLS